jgi:anti-anti-sigma factor
MLEARARRANGMTIIDLHGDVNRDAEPALLSAWSEAVADAGAGVLLNFSDVAYINSTGIAVIVGLLARARAEQRSVAVYGLSDHYRRVFEITRLIDFMEVYPDEGAALDGAAE